METTAEIRIESDDGKSILSKYENRLRALILTPEGTMIGNRDFGISFNMLGYPPHQAANLLVMELEKKLPIFLPEIELSRVTWTAGIDGVAVFNIQIRKAE